MPFSGNVYTPPTGSESAAPGQVVQSAIWNNIFTDLAAALTTLMTQSNTTPNWSNILAPNGGFAVWQRGAGPASNFSVSASSTQYTADRWYLTTGANQACTVSAQNGLTTAAPPSHAGKVQRTAGQTGTTALIFGYPLTSDEVYRLRGQQVSFSGLVRGGANFSPLSGAMTINLFVGTGTAQKAGAAAVNFTNPTTPLSITVDLTAGSTSSVSGTSTGTVPTNATQGELQVTWTPVGTAGTDDSITFDQFWLGVGTLIATMEDLPFDECLRECKRFYRKSFPYGTAPVQNAGLPGAVSVQAVAAAKIGLFVQFDPIEMYATAVFTSYSPSGATANWIDNTAGTSVAASFDTAAPSAKGVLIIGATVGAVNDLLYIHYQADSGL
jgi:hypothetical protein